MGVQVRLEYADITSFLQKRLNISDGRDILLLMNDRVSNSNRESIERWTTQKVWADLRENGFVDIDLLCENLLDKLSSNEAPLLGSSR